MQAYKIKSKRFIDILVIGGVTSTHRSSIDKFVIFQCVVYSFDFSNLYRLKEEKNIDRCNLNVTDSRKTLITTGYDKQNDRFSARTSSETKNLKLQDGRISNWYRARQVSQRTGSSRRGDANFLSVTT